MFLDLPFLELPIVIFWGYQDENLMLASQQYKAWPGRTLVTKTNHFRLVEDKG